MPTNAEYKDIVKITEPVYEILQRGKIGSHRVLETYVFPLGLSNDIIFNYILVCDKLWADTIWSMYVCEARTVMLR